MVNKVIGLFMRTSRTLLSSALNIPRSLIGALVGIVSRNPDAVRLLSKLASFHPRLHSYLERLYRHSLSGSAQSESDPRCRGNTTMAEGVNRGTRAVSEQIKEAIVSKGRAR